MFFVFFDGALGSGVGDINAVTGDVSAGESKLNFDEQGIGDNDAELLAARLGDDVLGQVPGGGRFITPSPKDGVKLERD